MEDCWIDPKGKIHTVKYCGHNDYAIELLSLEMPRRDIFEYAESLNVQYPYEILHARGWVRLTYRANYTQPVKVLGGCISLVNPMKNTMDPAMNARQLRVVKRICKDAGTTLHVAINDKRFW